MLILNVAESLQSFDILDVPGVQDALDADSYSDLIAALDQAEIEYGKENRKVTIQILEYARIFSKVSIYLQMLAPFYDDFESNVGAKYPNLSIPDLRNAIQRDDYDGMTQLLRNVKKVDIDDMFFRNIVLAGIQHRSYRVLHRILTDPYFGLNEFLTETRFNVYAWMPISILLWMYRYGVKENINLYIIDSAMELGLDIRPYLQLRSFLSFPFVLSLNLFETAHVIRTGLGYRYHPNYILTLLTDAETATKDQKDVVESFIERYPEYARYYEPKERSTAP